MKKSMSQKHVFCVVTWADQSKNLGFQVHHKIWSAGRLAQSWPITNQSDRFFHAWFDLLYPIHMYRQWMQNFYNQELLKFILN